MGKLLAVSGPPDDLCDPQELNKHYFFFFKIPINIFEYFLVTGCIITIIYVHVIYKNNMCI